MFNVKSTGSTEKMEKFLTGIARGDQYSDLQSYGQRCVDALASATPVDTGLTASSWTYLIEKKSGRYSLSLHNTNVRDGVPVAIILQYGHGTGTGGWVEGRDYINPAIRPIFDMIANEIWEKVKRG